MDFMAFHNIGIECCLNSNFQTGAVLDLAQHPITQFLANEIKVSLNTDDPGVSGIEIADEYQVAKEVVGLSKRQLQQVQLNGVHTAFIAETAKQQLLNQ
jgi:adenosine deaminase